MSDELKELQESAERAKEERALAPVSLTMAILAVLVATVSLLGHRAHTEEILLQTRATDQWAYYQAKNMRRNNLEALDQMLTVIPSKDVAQTAKVHEHFEQDIDKYRDQQQEIQSEARGLENEVEHISRRADRFDLGEVFLEVALVITSITLLTDRRAYWFTGMAFAALGIVTAASAYLVH
jgi:hypothetical protein